MKERMICNVRGEGNNSNLVGRGADTTLFRPFRWQSNNALICYVVSHKVVSPSQEYQGAKSPSKLVLKRE